MSQTAIFGPVFATTFLTFIVWVYMYVRRIRFLTGHPRDMTDELLHTIADEPKICPVLHLPLQSGSDGVLRRMKRPYGAQRARQALLDAAAVIPAFGIGADIIVGFPGETDAEFEETRQMVQDLPFSYLHVFRFSPRPGTAAAEMDDQVHPETISRRSEILRVLAAAKHEEFSRGLIGSVREAVVESASKREGWREATTDNYISILVPDRLSAGTVVAVKMERFEEGRLFASLPGE